MDKFRKMKLDIASHRKKIVERDLEKEFTCTDAINNLIDIFNKNETLNYTHVRDIEVLINAQNIFASNSHTRNI